MEFVEMFIVVSCLYPFGENYSKIMFIFVSHANDNQLQLRQIRPNEWMTGVHGLRHIEWAAHNNLTMWFPRGIGLPIVLSHGFNFPRKIAIIYTYTCQDLKITNRLLSYPLGFVRNVSELAIYTVYLYFYKKGWSLILLICKAFWYKVCNTSICFLQLNMIRR